jgi:hypothetical protein
VILSEKMKLSLKDAGKKLTGTKKRAFMAKVTEDYFEGSARKAETYLGWNRQAVILGQKEKETGIFCQDNYRARGRKKTELNQPSLEADINSLVDGQAQADPSFKSTLCYARISARAVREALILSQSYQYEQLPCRQTIGEILNRMGYRLKKP